MAQETVDKIAIYRLQHYTEFKDVALRNEQLQKIDPQKLGILSIKGETLLHIAILQKDWQFCAQILKKNPEVGVVLNKKGDTPLHYLAMAITQNPLSADVKNIKLLMQFLLNHGADINLLSKHSGKTPRQIILDFYAKQRQNEAPLPKLET